jgi:glucan phosphoethanolaminetransferase (alkaline phosphatase superfamily)
MAFQPKLILVTTASLVLLYALMMITFNSFTKCKEETEKLLKQKKIWVPIAVGVSFVLLSFMMTSKFTKAQRKAALARASAGGAATAVR